MTDLKILLISLISIDTDIILSMHVLPDEKDHTDLLQYLFRTFYFVQEHKAVCYIGWPFMGFTCRCLFERKKTDEDSQTQDQGKVLKITKWSLKENIIHETRHTRMPSQLKDAED